MSYRKNNVCVIQSRTAITFTTENVRWLARTPHVTHRDKMIVRGSAASYVDHNSCKDKKVAMLRPTNIKRYQKRSERHETRCLLFHRCRRTSTEDEHK
ncbi:hypothetical protein NECAME_14606 [Necator americanus]|uniref:Uncharacterized protein n=1 Tax=Necator americanus TaxID=51031 RepID=W2SLW2_NECAM|nr:hypothetical protein NECAME_14606 [Necator americanus]ETN70664.1 hypothetical protein NECAME_14606 [Necator americanus]